MKSSSDADTISNGLKINLNNLGSRIDAFIKQQQEVGSLHQEPFGNIFTSFLIHKIKCHTTTYGHA